MLTALREKQVGGEERLQGFSLKIEHSLLETLRRISKDERRSVGAQIKKFVEEGIAAHEAERTSQDSSGGSPHSGIAPPEPGGVTPGKHAKAAKGKKAS